MAPALRLAHPLVIFGSLLATSASGTPRRMVVICDDSLPAGAASAKAGAASAKAGAASAKAGAASAKAGAASAKA